MLKVVECITTTQICNDRAAGLSPAKLRVTTFGRSMLWISVPHNINKISTLLHQMTYNSSNNEDYYFLYTFMSSRTNMPIFLLHQHKSQFQIPYTFKSIDTVKVTFLWTMKYENKGYVWMKESNTVDYASKGMCLACTSLQVLLA